jgi:glutathione S-transferase
VYLAESLWASANDARGPLVGFPFSAYPGAPGDAERASTLKTLTGPKGLIGRYAVKWEERIEASGGPYLLGAEPCIADVGIFEALDFFNEVFGADEHTRALAPFPRLRALTTAVKSLGRLAEHCDVDRQSYDTFDEASGTHKHWGRYAKAVRTTLD